MRLTRLTLCNFRCFGPTPVTIELDDLTVLIGTNGTGKTAALLALTRLFGGRTTERTVDYSDFHIPPGTDESTLEELSLWIEATIAFPSSAGVPECFRHMVVQAPGAPPTCRIRLEAVWHRNYSSAGEIDPSLNWITSIDSIPPESAKQRVANHERANILVLYVPASRDPSTQLRHASGALLQPLLKAIQWADATRLSATDAASQVRDAVRGEAGMQALEAAITTEWNKLQDFTSLATVQLHPLSSEFEALVKQIEAVFSPAAAQVSQAQTLERLSDGLRSLFYFSLVGARFQLEQHVTNNATTPPLFDLEAAGLPILTIFAIEEPENHLAPQYLSRILALLTRLSTNQKAQVMLTSQSPSVLGRVDPESVRHFQLDSGTGQSSVRRLSLPLADEVEAFKYVKEAVLAFPELYFAKLVVLGEGDSEEIVLPRAARALGQAFDQTFVSVVPLGGRHVNHFWRLLNDLGIPHVTLLDFDRERQGGGWSRIKYVIEQLLTYRSDLTLQHFAITEAQLNSMPTWSLDDAGIIGGWLQGLEIYDLFFSAPLDLDFLLLEAFPTQYRSATDGTGPRIPTDDPSLAARLLSAKNAVLKAEGGDGHTYTLAEQSNFVWYQYLFLGRGKPVTHMRALASMDDAALSTGLPPVLRRMLVRCAVLSGSQTSAGTPQ
jgi:putative ATP-dependent endonuclease of OLD family